MDDPHEQMGHADATSKVGQRDASLAVPTQYGHCHMDLAQSGPGPETRSQPSSVGLV